MSKKLKFKNYAEMESEANGMTVYTFTNWKKGDKHRIYVKYRGRKDIGFITVAENGEMTHNIDGGYKASIDEFISKYEIEL